MSAYQKPSQKSPFWDSLYVRSFGDVPLGEPLLFVNAGGNMSAAIKQGHFAIASKIKAGTDWTVEMSK